MNYQFSNQYVFSDMIPLGPVDELTLYQCNCKGDTLMNVGSLRVVSIMYSSLSAKFLKKLCSLVQEGSEMLILHGITLESDHLWYQLWYAIANSKITHLDLMCNDPSLTPKSFPSTLRSLVYCINFSDIIPREVLLPVLDFVAGSDVESLNIGYIAQEDVRLLERLKSSKLDTLALECDFVEVVDVVGSLNRLVNFTLNTDNRLIGKQLDRLSVNPSIRTVELSCGGDYVYFEQNELSSPEKVLSSIIIFANKLKIPIDLIKILGSMLFTKSSQII